MPDNEGMGDLPIDLCGTCASRNGGKHMEIKQYVIKGFVVGDDLYGQRKKVDIRRETDHVPEIDEIEVPGLIDLEMISLEVRETEKGKLIDSIAWAGTCDEEYLYSIV